MNTQTPTHWCSLHTCWHKENSGTCTDRHRETHHQLQRQEVRAFFGWFSPHLTSDKPRFIRRANCLPVCSHKIHTQTSRWTTYWCHFLYQHCYSLDFSSLDRCLQRQRLAAQSGWTQPCQDHRDLIQNRFTRRAANWYNATNNSIRHLGLFWISVKKKISLTLSLFYSHMKAHSHTHKQSKKLCYFFSYAGWWLCKLQKTNDRLSYQIWLWK